MAFNVISEICTLATQPAGVTVLHGRPSSMFPLARFFDRRAPTPACLSVRVCPLTLSLPSLRVLRDSRRQTRFGFGRRALVSEVLSDEVIDEKLLREGR